LFGLSNRLTTETRGDDNRSRAQCTHHLDHYYLPVVAGDCLVDLLITLRHPAALHADSNPAFMRPAGTVFSVLVKCKIFTKHILSQ
jgi:hypothetical protein